MEKWDIGIAPDLAPEESQLSGDKLGECLSESINERHSFSCVELYIHEDSIDFPLGASLILWCDFFEKFEIPYIVTLGFSDGDLYRPEKIRCYSGGDGCVPVDWNTPDEFFIQRLTPDSISTRTVSFDEMLKELEAEQEWWDNRVFSINQSILDETPEKLWHLIRSLNSQEHSIYYQIRIKR